MSPQQIHNTSAGTKGQKTTIGDIPEEVLIYVFEISLQINPLNRTSTLCRLRRICRWWAQVIQRTPSFWCHISSLNGPKWTQLASERSKPLLLTVDVNGMSEHAAIVAVDHELPRAESLSMMLPFRRNVQQSSRNLHHSASQTLKKLSLSATGGSVQQTWGIFRGQWSHLRGLQIMQVNLDWDDYQLSRLERLEITKTSSSHPTLSQLLHVFGCCPDLHYAQLLNVGLAFGTDLPSSAITLPKLTTLILSCPTRSATQLLLKTRIPNCQHFGFQEDIVLPTEPAYPSNMLDALMSIVDTRSVQTDPSNTIIYFPIQRELALQCHLESPTSVTGLQLNLHLKNIGLEKELNAFKESSLWRMLEYGGLIIKEFDLKYGARVARHWPPTATS